MNKTNSKARFSFEGFGPVTRRQFLARSTVTSGGLVLGLNLSGCSSTGGTLTDDGTWKANAWLEIRNDNSVVFTLDRVEMGQGTYTGITTLIAEELDLDPQAIEVKFAKAEQVYRNPAYGLQVTGGSNSIATSWMPIRQAAASAREMLIASAAQVWSVDAASVVVSGGNVIHQPSAKSMPMGQLVSIAAKQDLPDDPTLKPASQFKYIGKHNQRLDAQSKSTGMARFGIDVMLDGMLYAVVIRPPSIGAKVLSHDGANYVGSKGVENVVEIDSGVAVVAKTYWSARKTSEQIKVDWQEAEDKPSSKKAFALYQDEAKKYDGDIVRETGDFASVEEIEGEWVEAEFEMPFLAHATMEPMNCVAHVEQDRAQVWTSTQAPDIAQVVVAKATHLGIDDVTVHSQFIGGGFGRRLNQDYVGEAAEISHKTGMPIKLIWSREEDMKNDFYRPATLHKFRAKLASSNSPQVLGWNHHIVGPGVMDWYVWDAAPAMFPFAPKFMFPMLGKVGLATQGTPMTPADRSAYEGADDLVYEFDSQEVMFSKADVGIPVGYWRSVGHSHNGFVTETFIDILAEKSGLDGVEFRLGLLKNQPRMATVLEKVVKVGGWGKPSSEGLYQGVAAHKSFGSYVAQLVELRVENSAVKVERVVCAVDCGTIVNPDIVRMQMESGIVFALTAALYGEVVFEEGQAKQSNFHDYQMLRLNEMPKIEVVMIDSEEVPTGVGEPSVPPLAAAMGAAIYKATGKRPMTLPFNVEA
jgi:isoquinoline 1-oxidoreductase beta subunit